MKFPSLPHNIRQHLTSEKALSPQRRRFLKYAALSSASLATAGFTWGYLEHERVAVSRVDVRLQSLPVQFDGLTIAHLSDIHHGIYTSLDFINRCVEITNELKPDIVALTGDFTLNAKRYIDPCGEALSGLRAGIGVFAILGNHDYYQSAGETRRALRAAGCTVLVDQRERLEKRGAKLSLLGADDLLYGHWDINKLLRDVPEEETRITLAHNPDFMGRIAERKRYVDFMLSGHTHGGQVRLPLIGAPHVISDYGQQHIIGLTQWASEGRAPMQIYTTRGIGSIMMPVRFECPPEIVLYTLRQA